MTKKNNNNKKNWDKNANIFRCVDVMALLGMNKTYLITHIFFKLLLNINQFKPDATGFNIKISLLLDYSIICFIFS